MIKTCKKMGIKTVAVHSDVDSSAVREINIQMYPKNIEVQKYESTLILTNLKLEIIILLILTN